jgi:hypothetical protein
MSNELATTQGRLSGLEESLSIARQRIQALETQLSSTASLASGAAAQANKRFRASALRGKPARRRKL